MPIPKPNESKEDFVDRCIPIVMDDGTAETIEQATAICHSIFDENKKSNNMKFNKTGFTPAFVRAIPDNIDETREVEFVISDSTRDRHKTVLNTDGWDLENYRKNPIVGYNHNVYGGGFFVQATPDNVIGSSDVFFEDRKLIGRVKFEPKAVNPMAEKIFQKVKLGTLRAASVGFTEIGEGKYGEKTTERDESKGGEHETYYFKGQELVEWSIVNIPSNPSATKRDGYKEPTISEILQKYDVLAKEFSTEQLRQTGIIAFLKHLEGIEELKLDKRKVEENLLDLADKRLRIIRASLAV